MKGVECTKYFPKQFNDGTITIVDGCTWMMDNRWVVPYNSFLCKNIMGHQLGSVRIKSAPEATWHLCEFPMHT